MSNLKRRTFLKKSTATTLGFTILPSYLVTGKPSPEGKLPPSKRINLGCVGVGGRATGVIPGVCKDGKAAPVAFCDVDFKARRVDQNLKRFPGVRQFKDFRVMLEKMGKDIDAVTIAVPDHSHYAATILAMSMGKHVYVEKPLTHSYREADLLMKAEKKFKVVTQMGNQGHTSAGSVQFDNLVKAGVIKNVTKIDAWKGGGLFFMDKKRRISKYPKGEEMPATLDWDLWCGPAQKKPFSKLYHPFDWRAFYLYGNGMLGDWGAHIIDFAHDFLKLGQPEKISPLLIEDPNDVIFPLKSHLRMNFPARGKDLPAVEMTWRDGADCQPKVAEKYMDKNDKGKLSMPRLGGAGTILYPEGEDYAVTRGSHSGTSNVINTEKRTELREHLRTSNPKFNHQASFTAACLGEDKTRSPFSIAGDLTKTMMLGIVCQKLNEELSFDISREQCIGNDKANALLEGPTPRKGWEQFYKIL
jgi:predicted dehydrogenase